MVTAGIVFVEEVLGDFHHLRFHRVLARRQNCLRPCLADDLAHGALRDRTNGLFRGLNVEEELPRIVDAPEHREGHVDDVLVAGQHLALVAFGADVDLADGADLRLLHAFDRPEGEVQARLGGPGVLAEAQHDAALVRLNLIDAVDANEAGENENRNDPGKPAAAPTGNDLLQLVLTLADEFIEVRRRGSTATAAAATRALRSALPPWPLAPRALVSATAFMNSTALLFTYSRRGFDLGVI